MLIIDFGKYGGKYWEDIATIDPNYVIWAFKNVACLDIPMSIYHSAVKNLENMKSDIIELESNSNTDDIREIIMKDIPRAKYWSNEEVMNYWKSF